MNKVVRWFGPTNEAKDDAEAYCGYCDYTLDNDDWNYCPDCGNALIWDENYFEEKINE